MNNNYFQKVTVIIPSREEEGFIGKCLESIMEQDYPKDLLEVIVVDGMSVDSTRKIVEEYRKKYPFIRLMDNPKKIVSSALNIGIQSVQGDIIVRMDAHNIYGKDYISKCVKYLSQYDVDNIGGVWITIPGSDTRMGKAISLVLSSPFGVGNAHFRIGVKTPQYVDTVPFGCYRKDVFKRIGLFDEDLVRNQDDEFNLRLIKNGGKIILVPDIVSYYHARESLGKLWRMYYQYGYFKPLVAKKVGGVFTWRQLIPPVFVGVVVLFGVTALFNKFVFLLALATISLYLFINLLFSARIALKNGLILVAFLPISFVTLHFSYGLGYLKGIWDFLIFSRHKKKDHAKISISR